MTLERPVFRERQRLTAGVFAAEQASRIERLARHAHEAHHAGIATGLALSLSGGAVEVGPGTALMPSGRVLCMTVARALEIPAGDGRHGVVLREGAAAGRRGTVSTAEIGIAEGGDASAIRIGAVIRAGGALTVDLSERQALGAIGERVTAPDGSATLSLGFSETRAQSELSVAFGDAAPVLRLGRMRGARLDGDLSIRPGTAGPTALSVPSLAFPEAGEPPEETAPWSLRRVKSTVDDQELDELRLELHHPGKSGDPALSRLVIGTLAPGLTGLAIDADGRTTLFQDGSPATTGIDVPPPGRIAFAPVSPGPTDPAFAAALTDAMLQGIAWALLIATINTGVTGVVTFDGTPAAGITVTVGKSSTITDTTGRFYLAAVGWPGETVILTFADDGELGARPAVVGAAPQVFDFDPDVFDGDII